MDRCLFVFSDSQKMKVNLPKVQQCRIESITFVIINIVQYRNTALKNNSR